MKNKQSILSLPLYCFYVLLIAIIFSSCFDTENVKIKNTHTTIEGRDIHIYIIDSCEYIGNIYGGNGDMITHKGNCKFCAERNKKH